MKLNKKGFTLIELLAVITILALLSGLAVPNIISTINNNKKDSFLLDAKRMVSKAKNLISSSREDRNNLPIVYSFKRLNEDEEFASDSDGGEYNENSYVRVSVSTNGDSSREYSYCICVMGSKRKIGNGETCDSSISGNCIDSESLTGIDVVKDY